MKLNLFVHAKPASRWDIGENVIDGHVLSVWAVDNMKSSGYFLVCPVTIDFEMPPEWDPRTQQAEALKEKRQQHSDAILKIDRQINSLLAIENLVEA